MAMPVYFSLSIQFQKENLYPLSVTDFYTALGRAGLVFKSGYWNSEDNSFAETTASDQGLLEQDFKLEPTETHLHSCKQISFDYRRLSHVRGLWMSRHPGDGQFSFEIIIPESEILKAGGSCSFIGDRIQDVIEYAGEIWKFDPVKAIRAGLEADDVSVELTIIEQEKVPKTIPFAIVGRRLVEHIDLSGYTKKRTGTSGILIQDSHRWDYQGESGEVEEDREKEVMEVSLQAGRLLLKNGAEVSRVEETMDRICNYYGVRSGNILMLSNGISTMVGDRGEPFFTKMGHIPVSGAHLDCMTAANQLSREIKEGRYAIKEVGERLEDVKRMPGKTRLIQVMASGYGNAAFCYSFEGSPWDSTTAFLTGLTLYLYVLYVNDPHPSKTAVDISGGALITTLCSTTYLLGVGQHLNYMVIGSVMPLIPGAPFTNTTRDTANGDYISGLVRMLGTLLVLSCIVIGVDMGFTVIGWLKGSTLP